MELQNFKNKKNVGKTLLFSFLCTLVLSIFTSCTADELPTTNPIKQQNTTAKDGEIVPPPPPPIK
jgi:hypothetical protein